MALENRQPRQRAWRPGLFPDGGRCKLGLDTFVVYREPADHVGEAGR